MRSRIQFLYPNESVSHIRTSELSVSTVQLLNNLHILKYELTIQFLFTRSFTFISLKCVLYIIVFFFIYSDQQAGSSRFKRWTPSVRRCSPWRGRQSPSTPPSGGSRTRPRSTWGSPIRFDSLIFGFYGHCSQGLLFELSTWIKEWKKIIFKS